MRFCSPDSVSITIMSLRYSRRAALYFAMYVPSVTPLLLHFRPCAPSALAHIFQYASSEGPSSTASSTPADPLKVMVSSEAAPDNQTTFLPSSEHPTTLSKRQQEKARKERAKAQVVVGHMDIIKDAFWEQCPWILGGYVPKAA